jgi:hypothetical protein
VVRGQRYSSAAIYPRQRPGTFRFFIPCIFYTCYNKNYQQMRLYTMSLFPFISSFPYMFRAFMSPSLEVLQAVFFYVTIWFMQCFVDRMRASADWFVVVTSTTTNQSADAHIRSTTPQSSPLTHAYDQQSTA